MQAKGPFAHATDGASKTPDEVVASMAGKWAGSKVGQGMCWKVAAFVLVVSGGALVAPSGPVHGGAPPDLLTKGKAQYSLKNEELVIRHFFDDKRDGFYLDVGCFHWERSSNTAYLEKHLGWSGIAIDAQASLAEGWKANRPRARFFNYLVSDHSGTEDKFFLGGGVSSTSREHVQHMAKTFGKVDKFEPKEIAVPTITLNELLDREGIKEIDFLTMDIEGHEPQALAGFDIKRFRPKLVCIEAMESSKAKLTEYFQANGYEQLTDYLKQDPWNWYFKPKAP